MKINECVGDLEALAQQYHGTYYCSKKVEECLYCSDECYLAINRDLMPICKLAQSKYKQDLHDGRIEG